MMATYSISDFLVIGVFSGLNAACWGLYKDSLYEEVRLRKFIRSIIVSLGVTFFLYFALKQLGIKDYNMGVFFGAVVLFERFLTEIYKGFFRTESQKKYKIPVHFHWGTYIVKNVLIRGGVGILLVLFIVGITFYLHILSLSLETFRGNIVVGLALGLAMGILEAIGGAEKDAPFEGFDPLKVYRSPIVHMLWGGALSYFTDAYVLLFLAAGGLGRMSIEFYKTFVVQKVPGKFKAEKPEFPGWKAKRTALILPYAMTWIVFFFYLLGL